jgi:AmmeMemoRadiSam system protein B/AmmeMemoRadiSam system protein A
MIAALEEGAMKICITGLLLAYLATVGCSEPKKPVPSQVGDAAEPDKPGAEDQTAASKPAKPKKIKNAFPPQVAGGFYTDSATELRAQVEKFVDQAKSASHASNRDIVGILSPHAGYVYSGPIAGEAFRAVQGRGYRTVVVMALSHRRGADKLALLDRPAYDTPLGSLPIDGRLVRRLLHEHGDLFEVTERMFRGEHSLEVQLPFVQVALPGVKIVPIIVAVPDDAVLARAGKALYQVLGQRSDVLFVVSTDLSHHHPYDVARKLDAQNLEALEQWKIDEWKKFASRQAEGMCGFKPVLTFVELFAGYEAGRRKVTRIDYRNSGDTAGDKSSVVGYGALAFSVEKGMRSERASEKDFGPYGAAERRWLMELAKRAVAAAAKGGKLEPEEPPTEDLRTMGAAFVTLKKDGQLRGCIGHVIARVPLHQCVADVARSAAIHDTRFSPVQPTELQDLSYEISVLTAPEPIKPDDVVVGTHGLIMSRGGRSGLLLPQVPVEWGWDREEFLRHTCRKAGLPLDCWQDSETKIESFRAIVWGEEDLED